MSQTLKLNGIPLNGHAPITWGRAGGVAPVTVTLELAAKRADAIFTAQGYLTLELNDRPISKLQAVEVGAGRTPYVKTLTLADLRWELSYRTLIADFNLRRRTGDRSLVGPRTEIAVGIPTVAYARHSLNNEAVHTPGSILRSVFGQLGFAYSIEGSLPNVNVEDLILSGRADGELAKVLSYLPGMQVEVTDDGRFRVYNEVQGQDEARAYYALATGKFPRIADRSRQRPALVAVDFVEEPELRIDFTEAAAATTVPSGDPDLLTWRNVVQVIEPNLAIPAVVIPGATTRARTVGYGTWVDMDEYLAALAPMSHPPGSPVLTQQVIRDHWLQGFSRLRTFYTLPDKSPDPLWQARLDTIYTHWRQSFQLAERWRSRLLSLEAYRAAVYDTTTATRAPACAYADYNVRPSWRGIASTVNEREEEGWNIRRFTENGRKVTGLPFVTSGIDPTVQPAPFNITVTDPEAFIIKLTPRADPHYQSDQVAPGVINPAQFLSARMGAFNREREAFRLLWEWAQLIQGWDLSVVMTGIKASPNGHGRYRRETVLPYEAEGCLGRSFGACQGPVLFLTVPMQLVTARYAWLDSEAQAIRQSFLTGSPMPNTCLVNGDHLRHVAVALAARAYETYLDTMDGASCATAFDEKIAPVGPLKIVAHTLSRDGGLVTRLTFEPQGRMLDLWALLPDGTRKALQHLVRPGIR